jgi:hypothetical protein
MWKNKLNRLICGVVLLFAVSALGVPRVFAQQDEEILKISAIKV